MKLQCKKRIIETISESCLNIKCSCDVPAKQKNSHHLGYSGRQTKTQQTITVLKLFRVFFTSKSVHMCICTPSHTHHLTSCGKRQTFQWLFIYPGGVCKCVALISNDKVSYTSTSALPPGSPIRACLWCSRSSSCVFNT